ncbi:hypothetical protein J4410_07580 [Candidatus Woesearchaeota archaeon]|nr:hypothetical protein [Candidatus Woesearchaeota archaeon]
MVYKSVYATINPEATAPLFGLKNKVYTTILGTIAAISFFSGPAGWFVGGAAVLGAGTLLHYFDTSNFRSQKKEDIKALQRGYLENRVAKAYGPSHIESREFRIKHGNGEVTEGEFQVLTRKKAFSKTEIDQDLEQADDLFHLMHEQVQEGYTRLEEAIHGRDYTTFDIESAALKQQVGEMQRVFKNAYGVDFNEGLSDSRATVQSVVGDYHRRTRILSLIRKNAEHNQRKKFTVEKVVANLRDDIVESVVQKGLAKNKRLIGYENDYTAEVERVYDDIAGRFMSSYASSAPVPLSVVSPSIPVSSGGIELEDTSSDWRSTSPSYGLESFRNEYSLTDFLGDFRRAESRHIKEGNVLKGATIEDLLNQDSATAFKDALLPESVRTDPKRNGAKVYNILKALESLDNPEEVVRTFRYMHTNYGNDTQRMIRSILGILDGQSIFFERELKKQHIALESNAADIRHVLTALIPYVPIDVSAEETLSGDQVPVGLDSFDEHVDQPENASHKSDVGERQAVSALVVGNDDVPEDDLD